MKSLGLAVLAALVAGAAIWAPPLPARTWRVPQDAPTIQAGVDSATTGDTVQVSCGTYFEHGITMKNGVTLSSATGDWDCVTIDAEGLGRVFYCSGLDFTTVITGFTITGGSANDGAGMYCTLGSGFSLRNCHFTANNAEWSAGLACVIDSSPLVTGCLFTFNVVEWDGAAIGCSNSSPSIRDCTFYRNEGRHSGSAIRCQNGASPVLENCLITYQDSHSTVMLPVWCDEASDIFLRECNVWGDQPIWWWGCLTDQIGVRANFSAAPGFCDPENGDFTLCADSWCLPGLLPGGQSHGLVGALPAGCEACGPHVETERRTWGEAKALYR